MNSSDEWNFGPWKVQMMGLEMNLSCQLGRHSWSCSESDFRSLIKKAEMTAKDPMFDAPFQQLVNFATTRNYDLKQMSDADFKRFCASHAVASDAKN